MYQVWFSYAADIPGTCVNIYRRIIILRTDRQLACKVELNSQAGQLLPAIVGDENILCENHLRSSSETIRSILVENCASLIWIWRQSEYVGDPSQMRRGPTGTDRRMLSVPTGVYVAGRSAGYENQALSTLRFCFSSDL